MTIPRIVWVLLEAALYWYAYLFLTLFILPYLAVRMEEVILRWRKNHGM